METLSPPYKRSVIKSYWQLTKPGILFGNAITAFGGFALASAAGMQSGLLFATLLGLCLIMASGCVSNNYMDRLYDQKMERTKNRALVIGDISLQSAKIFSVILCFAGIGILIAFTNPLTVSTAVCGLFVYVMLYSPLKYRTVHATLIGSIAGAAPPVVGYCAVTNRLDTGAFLLFAMLVCWQMPHFYAIAIYRLKDYAAASVPVLPLKKGIQATKVQMVIYAIAFLGICSLMAISYQSWIYLAVSSVLGGVWLVLCINGFKSANETKWARGVFIFSLVVITGLCTTIALT